MKPVVQVKERRQLRDEQAKRRKESEQLLRAAQREAQEVVKKEEKMARARAAREEQLLNQQIKIVRSELRERQEISRCLAAEERTAMEKEARRAKRRRNVKSEVIGVEDNSATLLKAAEDIIESEKKRQRTRSELSRQLEEAKAKEAKEGIVLLHRCFSAWYETVVQRRAKLGKAVAVREWRLMVRAWGGWKRFVMHCRARKERDRVTREMQRVKR